MGRGDEESWDVEAVMGVKKNLRKKSVEILVKWKGKHPSKNNWEDISAADADPSLLEEFQDAIDCLKRNKRADTDEEVEDKEMGKDEYVVEDILGVQWNIDYEQLEYYIKWEGWDNQYNNWEPESNCACDDLIEPFEKAADFLKTKYGKKPRKPRSAPRSNQRSKSRRSPSPQSGSDEEVVEKKRPGPKSKTVANKRPGPKSRTAPPTPEPTPNKRPGPKSRTTPAPASAKRPGPKSRTSAAKPADDSDAEEKKSGGRGGRGSDSEEEEEKRGSGDRNGKYKKMSDSEDEKASSDRSASPPASKRPGPKSRTSAGPASKKRPGPKSRTNKDDSGEDSD